jgi:hypothetical protein
MTEIVSSVPKYGRRVQPFPFGCFSCPQIYASKYAAKVFVFEFHFIPKRNVFYFLNTIHKQISII